MRVEHLGVVVEEYEEGASLACELLQSVWDDTGMDGMKERMIMEWEPDADLTSIMGQKRRRILYTLPFLFAQAVMSYSNFKVVRLTFLKSYLAR